MNENEGDLIAVAIVATKSHLGSFERGFRNIWYRHTIEAARDKATVSCGLS